MPGPPPTLPGKKGAGTTLGGGWAAQWRGQKEKKRLHGAHWPVDSAERRASAEGGECPRLGWPSITGAGGNRGGAAHPRRQNCGFLRFRGAGGGIPGRGPQNFGIPRGGKKRGGGGGGAGFVRELSPAGDFPRGVLPFRSADRPQGVRKHFLPIEKAKKPAGQAGPDLRGSSQCKPGGKQGAGCLPDSSNQGNGGDPQPAIPAGGRGFSRGRGGGGGVPQKAVLKSLPISRQFNPPMFCRFENCPTGAFQGGKIARC